MLSQRTANVQRGCRATSKSLHKPITIRPTFGSSLVACPRQQRTVVCQGLFGLGLPELAVIAGVAALIFGPSKLPELGRGLGKTVKSFQDAAGEFNSELKAGMEADKKAEAPAEKKLEDPAAKP